MELVYFIFGIVVVLGGGIVGAFYFGRKILHRLRYPEGLYGTIEMFVGRPGNGKTTLLVRRALVRSALVHAKGRRAVIAANFTIVPPPGVEFMKVDTHPQYGLDVIALTRKALELLDDPLPGYIFLAADEAGICWPARAWREFGLSWQWFFQQSRKLFVEVGATAQSEVFVESQFRELTAATHYVTAQPPATVARRLDGLRPRKIKAVSYDRTAVGVKDAWLGSFTVKYDTRLESRYNTDDFVLPPPNLKGVEELRELLLDYLASKDQNTLDPLDLGVIREVDRAAPTGPSPL